MYVIKTIKKVMKSRFLAFVIVIYSTSISYSQKGFLKLEDIMVSRKLSAKTVSGFNSMKNGEHYSKSVYTPIFKIEKYNFKDGKAIETILTENDLVYNGDTIAISDYQFSTDES